MTVHNFSAYALELRSVIQRLRSSTDIDGTISYVLIHNCYMYEGCETLGTGGDRHTSCRPLMSLDDK